MNLKRFNKNRYVITNNSGYRLGELYREVDGFFMFWPECVTGSYTEQFLREVADKLRDLNKKWNETIEKEMKR